MHPSTSASAFGRKTSGTFARFEPLGLAPCATWGLPWSLERGCTLKLEITMETRKDARGRIFCHVAKLGQVEGTGATPQEAQAALAQRIITICTEGSTPILMREPSDGHVWATYRLPWGEWTYAHFRPVEGSPRLRESGSCICADSTRDGVASVMARDFEHYPR